MEAAAVHWTLSFAPINHETRSAIWVSAAQTHGLTFVNKKHNLNLATANEHRAPGFGAAPAKAGEPDSSSFMKNRQRKLKLQPTPLKGMRVGTLDTDEFLLTAMQLPDGSAKCIAVGDEFSPVECPAENYEAAVAMTLQTAALLDKGNFWERAEFSAARIEALLQKFGRPEVVTLSDFESEADLKFLKAEAQEQEGTLLYHRLTNAAVKTIAEEDFEVRVEFKILNMRAYMDWLADQKMDNTAKARAQFCSM